MSPNLRNVTGGRGRSAFITDGSCLYGVTYLLFPAAAVPTPFSNDTFSRELLDFLGWICGGTWCSWLTTKESNPYFSKIKFVSISGKFWSIWCLEVQIYKYVIHSVDWNSSHVFFGYPSFLSSRLLYSNLILYQAQTYSQKSW